jgi:sRNA-binding carbon storage regulator CsrA
MVALMNRMLGHVTGLATTRCPGEAMFYDLGDGRRIEVWVTAVKGSHVSIKSKAPSDIRIIRNELDGKPAAQKVAG